MKNLYRFFLAAAAVAAAVSCVEDINEVVKPEVEVAGTQYEFTASINADTKAVLDRKAMKTLWEGDMDGNEYITVMEPGNVNTYVAKEIYDPTDVAKFALKEGGKGLEGKAAVAVYPAGDWTCAIDGTNVSANVTYATTQTAVEKTFDPKGPVAFAYNADVTEYQHFSFVNTSALLQLKIAAETDEVKKITVKALGGEAISGAMTVAYDGTNYVVKAAAEGAEDYVDLVAEEGKAFKPGSTYYIAVAPAVLTKGFSVSLNTNRKVYTISSEAKFARNSINDLGELAIPMYPKPDKIQLTFKGVTENGADAVIDLGVTVPGKLTIAYNYGAANGSEYLDGYYLAQSGTGAPKSWDYEVIPTDETKGIVRIMMEATKAAEPVDIPYSGYVDDTKPFMVDGRLLGESETLTVTPAEEPCGVYVKDYHPEPGTTPEGKQWIWNDENGNRLLDFNYTKHIATDLTTDEEVTLDALIFADQYEGQYTYSKAFTGYNVEVTGLQSGVITYSSLTNNPVWGEQMEYIRIEYSNFTSKSLDLYSPSQFDEDYPVIGKWVKEPQYVRETDDDGRDVKDDYGNYVYKKDDDGNYIYQRDENKNIVYLDVAKIDPSGEPLYVDSAGRPSTADVEDSYPLVYSGIGMCRFDDKWNLLPVTTRIVTNPFTLKYEDSGI